MQRFLDSLAAVIEWNQRTILLAGVRQLVLVIVTGFGLTRLAGAWWCLCLAVCVGMFLWGVFLAFAFKWQSDIELKPPWRAVGLEDYAKSEPLRLELHLLEGGAQVIRVPRKLVDEVMSAAREAEIEIVTEATALQAVNATSIRLGNIRDIEALAPCIPTIELREELLSALAKLRVHDVPASKELLYALERVMEHEQKAQRKKSLPTPYYEKEIREKLAAFAKLMA